ncbi:MAG: alpha/beta hydrolase [Sphingomicrobium sp.]
MAVEPFRFAGARGQILDGRIELPQGPARGTAVFAHCFTCTKQSKAATSIAGALAEAGWRVLRFDFTGLGDSDGAFAEAGFVCDIDDLVAASEALAGASHRVDLLVGHSLGGAAVIAAAERVPSVAAIATIGAPFKVDHVLDRLGEQIASIPAEGEAQVSIGGRPFTISRKFIDQLFDQPQAERLGRLGRALLVCHSPTDEMVALANAKAIFDAARHPRSFIALDGADHLLTKPGSADYAAGIIAAWARCYAPQH